MSEIQATTKPRIASIDIMRGLVILLTMHGCSLIQCLYIPITRRLLVAPRMANGLSSTVFLGHGWVLSFLPLFMYPLVAAFAKYKHI